MRVCDCGCGQEITTPGRGQERRFISDAHRADFHSNARRIGVEALRRPPGAAKLTAEERVRKAKHRAADLLAAYIEQRRLEIAAGSPRLVDIAARGLPTGPDLTAAPVSPVETDERFEHRQSFGPVKITDQENYLTASL